jgi:hypothetical protein
MARAYTVSVEVVYGFPRPPVGSASAEQVQVSE